MSNIQIYQICYLPEHLLQVKNPLIPYNNLENLNPELCEYPIFKSGKVYAIQKNLDLWGFVSPKFEMKTGISGQQFIDFIETDPTRADVYFINPTPINESLSPSVLTQGENCHPGIIDLISRNIKKMNLPNELNNLWINLPNLWMDSKTFALCNYFVGNRKFWSEYLTFVDLFLAAVKSNETDYDMMFKAGANYGPNKKLPYFTFVVERLFSLFINITTLRVNHYTYTRDELLQKTKLSPQILDELRALSAMKLAAISGNRPELLEHYIFYRNRFASANAYIFNLE